MITIQFVFANEVLWQHVMLCCVSTKNARRYNMVYLLNKLSDNLT